MENNCQICNTTAGTAADDQSLVKCYEPESYRWVHESCLKPEDHIIENDIIKWKCSTHASPTQTQEIKDLNDENVNKRRGSKGKGTTAPDDDSQEQEEDVQDEEFSVAEVDNDPNCPHCKKPLITGFDPLVKCSGCLRLAHVRCLDHNMKSRVKDFLYTCQTCENAFLRIHKTRGTIPRNNARQSQTRNRVSFNPHNQALGNASSPRRNNEDSVPPSNNLSPIPQNHGRRSSISRNLRDISAPADINESVAEMVNKMSYKELPEVTDANVSWATFYETYTGTKDLFSDYENISRIKKAVKDSVILSIGGSNLFDLRTYDEAIEKINRRVSTDTSFLTKEASELQRVGKFGELSFKKMIEYIDKISNFSTKAKAYNDLSYTTNILFINTLADKFPKAIYNKWIIKQCTVQASRLPIRIKHLVDVLEAELPNLIMRDRMSILMQNNTETRRPEHSRSHNNHTDEETSIKKKFDPKWCWLHKNIFHPTHKCRDLWDMDGKTVAELAAKNNRCTLCGQEKHWIGSCPFKVTCRVKDCEGKHHALYCYKRSAGWKPKSPVPQQTNTHKILEEVIYDEEEVKHMSELLNEMSFEEDEDERYFTNEKSDSEEESSIHHHVTTNLHSSKSKLTYNESANSILGAITVMMENSEKATFLVDTASSVSMIESNTLFSHYEESRYM